MSIYCLCVFMAKRNFFFSSVSRLAELHTCLAGGFILNFLSVGVGTGNFSFAKAHPSFYSEVVGKHLCFCEVSFHHWVEYSGSCVCLCKVPHPKTIKPCFLSFTTARGKFLISCKILCDSCKGSTICTVG